MPQVLTARHFSGKRTRHSTRAAGVQESYVAVPKRIPRQGSDTSLVPAEPAGLPTEIAMLAKLPPWFRITSGEGLTLTGAEQLFE